MKHREILEDTTSPMIVPLAQLHTIVLVWAFYRGTASSFYSGTMIQQFFAFASVKFLHFYKTWESEACSTLCRFLFFSAEPFPDCEPRNHGPRNYLGFRFSRKCFKQSRKRDVMEISTGLTCPLLPATFPSLLMIILVTILPWNSLRSDPNNPHMSTQPSRETLITPCHSCRCPPGQRQPPYQGF